MEWQQCRPWSDIVLEQSGLGPHCMQGHAYLKSFDSCYIFSSSQLVTPGSVEFVFNVITVERSSGRTYPRKGICTGWLEQLEACNDNKGGTEGLNGCDVPTIRKV